MLANSKAISTNLGALGLDLHSSSPEPVNLFGAQSSLRGAHKQSFGGHGPRMPHCGAGPALMSTRGWFQRSGSSSFDFLLAESDSVERSDHNVLQGSLHFVFSFQLFFSSTDTFRLQRWSPRGHILKSLASKLQILENCSVLGSRTAVFLEFLKFCRSFFVKKNLFFWRFFDFIFLRTPEKKFGRPYYYFFFGEHLRL